MLLSRNNSEEAVERFQKLWDRIQVLGNRTTENLGCKGFIDRYPESGLDSSLDPVESYMSIWLDLEYVPTVSGLQFIGFNWNGLYPDITDKSSVADFHDPEKITMYHARIFPAGIIAMNIIIAISSDTLKSRVKS